MNFEEFKILVKNNIINELPDDYKDAAVELIPVCRNQESWTGLMVKKSSSTIILDILLEPFYEKYLNGFEASSILEKIAHVIAYNQVTDIDLSFICDWNKVKDKIIPKLVPIKGNTDYLSDKIYTVFAEDLAVIYQIIVKGFKDEGYITITDEIFNSINGLTGKHLLFEAATNNIAEDSTCVTMESVIKRKFSADVPEAEIDMFFAAVPKMLVLSNKDCYNGSAQLLNKKAIQKVVDEIGDNFIIIPSSIHEVIAMPDVPGIDGLTDMIRSINSTDIHPCERLSDHPYRYYKGQITAV